MVRDLCDKIEAFIGVDIVRGANVSVDCVVNQYNLKMVFKRVIKIILYVNSF